MKFRLTFTLETEEPGKPKTALIRMLHMLEDNISQMTNKLLLGAITSGCTDKDTTLIISFEEVHDGNTEPSA